MSQSQHTQPKPNNASSGRQESCRHADTSPFAGRGVVPAAVAGKYISDYRVSGMEARYDDDASGAQPVDGVAGSTGAATKG